MDKMSSEGNKKEKTKKLFFKKGPFFGKLIRFVIVVLLIPVVIALTLSFYDYIGNIEAFGDESFFFLLGCLAYLVFHTIIYKPTFLYVFTHEMLHAIPTWFTGGRVKRFRVSSKGGFVETTRSSLLILLFPYIIPIFSLIFILAYYVTGTFFEEVADYLNLFIFLIGASLSFHIVNTSEALKTKQPDIEQAGFLLSIIIVYIFNLLIISGIFNFIFHNFSFLELVKDSLERAKDIYIFLYTRLFYV
jgi:hypothetical protein